MFLCLLFLLFFEKGLRAIVSASPKPHPSKPHPCHTTSEKSKLRCSFRNAALQKLHCNSRFSAVRMSFSAKNCAAASEKLQCNIEKAALQESGAFLPLFCGFQVPRLDLLIGNRIHNRNTIAASGAPSCCLPLNPLDFTMSSPNIFQ